MKVETICILYILIIYYGPETYFTAIYNGTESDVIEACTRQNGVIGVASSQLRLRAHQIAEPIEDDSTIQIPCPHVYLANMKVDETMRRKGVGTALLSAAREHATEWSEKMNEEVPLALSMDNENDGAIQLYEKFGFDYLETNDVFRVMVLQS